MKRLTVILVSLALLVIAGCSDVGFKRTKSGLMYKVMSEKGAAEVKRGDWLKLHIRQTIHDSVLAETYTQMPIYIQSDSIGPLYDPREIIPFLRKGDSAVVVIFADTIFKKQGGLPEFMKRKDKLILTFKVLDVFKSDSLKIADETVEISRAQEKQKSVFEEKRVTAIKEIEDYLAQNKLTYQKTAGGTYVVVKDPGNGPKADSGTTASVLYKGTLFKTDRVFDQNMDGSKQPYPVAVGTGGVIRGWDEALPFFNKGGKGTVYVPFFQGYGEQGPLNSKFTTMCFDIEIVDVKPGTAAPAPPPNPQQPQN